MSSPRRILPVAPARARCYNTVRVRLAQEAIIMDLVAAVSPMTCAALIAVVLTKPSVRIKGHTVNIFWVVPLIGAAILLLFGTISPREVLAGLTAQNSINPLKILVLFLSMTLISIFLDCAGFFRHLATAVLQRQNASQFRLFALLYALANRSTPVYAFESNRRDYDTAVATAGLPANLHYIHAVSDSDFAAGAEDCDLTIILDGIGSDADTGVTDETIRIPLKS